MKTRASLVMDYKAHKAMIKVFNAKVKELHNKGGNPNLERAYLDCWRYHVRSVKILRKHIRRTDW